MYAHFNTLAYICTHRLWKKQMIFSKKRDLMQITTVSTSSLASTFAEETKTGNFTYVCF